MHTLIMNRVFTAKSSIRLQISAAFASLTVLSVAVTLAICYGFLYGTGKVSYESASKSLFDTVKANSFATSLDIAASINQNLQTIGEGMCQSGVLYASSLLENSANSVLAAPVSYKEFNFEDGCTNSTCPSDFGPLMGRSRLPFVVGYSNGSLLHSSVYLYSGSTHSSFRNESTWLSALSLNPDIASTISALSYQDLDMKTFYEKGPNSSLFFYVSVQVGPASGYVDVHRSYPGLNKGNDVNYHPSLRSWFTHAPEGGVYLYGPYVETFTGLKVVTLSSKKLATAPSASPLTIVVGAVMLLSSVEDIVQSVAYPYQGFGAVLAVNGLQVIVWKPGANTFDAGRQTFLTIDEVDLELSKNDLASPSTFEYTDAQGIDWIVSSQPFFESTDGITGTSSNALIVLVFAKKDLAAAALPSLQANIDDTTISVTVKTVVIAAAITATMLVAIWLLIIYVTTPLQAMQRVSGDVMKQNALEEYKRDYSSSLREELFSNSRYDEIGLLTAEYRKLVTALHERALAKKMQPKYPENPFSLQHLWQTSANNDPNFKLSWEEFYSAFSHVGNAPSLPKLEPIAEPEAISGDLDVLGSLSLSSARPPVSEAQLYAPVANADVENAPSPSPPLPACQPPPCCLTAHQLKYKFLCLVLLLCSGLLAIVVITALSLTTEGSSWMSETKVDIETQQLLHLNALASAKSVFTAAFLGQLIVQLSSMASFANAILNYRFTSMGLVSTGRLLPSYSMLPDDPFVANVVTSNQFSSYFFQDAASCSSHSCFGQMHSNSLTNLTSLMDYKFRSYSYGGSIVSVIQLGFESTGFIRNYPYSKSSSLAKPKTCLINDLTHPSCSTNYFHSGCSIPSLALPAYDARCRSWYQLAASKADPDEVYFQYPKLSSAGQFIVTAVTPMTNIVTQELIGVLNFNVVVSRLSALLNSVPILSSGYSYLLDSSNSSVVIHPKATATCISLECVEGFSASEFLEFREAVLDPMRQGWPSSSSYTKLGKEWRIALHGVDVGTVRYTIVSTVPSAEIFAATTEVQQGISKSVVNMSIAMAFCMAVELAAIFFFAYHLVLQIVTPISDLQLLLVSVNAGQLSTSVEMQATSYDMLVLLEAFSNLMVALRFGSDSYSRGQDERAVAAFADALRLYTTTGNLIGMASAHNNLGAVLMEQQKYAESEKHFNMAIEIGQQLLANTQTTAATAADVKTIRKLSRVLSDRRGNLVVLKLSQGDFPEAFAMLEKLLIEDKSAGYVMGCVIKQGILGHYYLKQNEFKSAERTFQSALQFVKQRDEKLFEASWNHTEAEIAEQMALYNMGCLFAKQQDNISAEYFFVECLSRGAHMQLATTTKALTAMHKLLLESGRNQAAAVVSQLAKDHDLNLHAASRHRFKPKRVVFVLDYSGSMAGSKIRTAVENLTTIVSKHIAECDQVMLVHFTTSVHTDFELLQKRDNEAFMLTTIGSLCRPSGSTALYDAIDTAANQLQRNPTDSDWIIVLTDGEDNSSSLAANALMQKFRTIFTATNVIVIGVGLDVCKDVLENIAKATKLGVFIAATADKQSITEAFGTAIKVIEECGQVIIED